jgi:hypothetical protein
LGIGGSFSAAVLVDASVILRVVLGFKASVFAASIPKKHAWDSMEKRIIYSKLFFAK